MTQTLQGLTVLVTRSEEGNTSLSRLLEARGAGVLRLPTVEFIEPDSWDDCDRALLHLQTYDGFLFTSRTAVERFRNRAAEVNRNALTILAQRPVYAIGDKTEAALEAAGIPVVPAPEFSSAEEFAASFQSLQVSGKRFLFPKSDIARDTLPRTLRGLGAIVDEAIVYKNVAPRQKDLDFVRNALSRGEITIVAFFSPSAVRTFVQLMGRHTLSDTAVAVIGQTTEAAAAGFGISSVIRAASPTEESLVEAICDYALSGKER